METKLYNIVVDFSVGCVSVLQDSVNVFRVDFTSETLDTVLYMAYEFVSSRVCGTIPGMSDWLVDSSF